MVRDEYRDGMTLDDYARAWVDMHPHIGDLQELAAKAKTIVEFGLRGGVSTWAMLDAMPRRGSLVGVDIDPLCPIPPRVVEDKRFKLVIGDSVAVPLPDHADLVMIDSSHEYDQTVKELARADSLTPSVIALHDYNYPPTPGVGQAVDEFVADGRYTFEVRPSHWGLAVLRRA